MSKPMNRALEETMNKSVHMPNDSPAHIPMSLPFNNGLSDKDGRAMSAKKSVQASSALLNLKASVQVPAPINHSINNSIDNSIDRPIDKPVDKTIDKPIHKPKNKLIETSFCLLLVIAFHLMALVLMMWSYSPNNQKINLPTIQGVFIAMPAAEVVQQPSKKTAPATRPEVKPTEEVKTKHNAKVNPPKKVLVKSSEIKIDKPEIHTQKNQRTQAEKVVEKINEENQASAPATVATEDNNMQGATLIPPTLDANPMNNPAPAYPKLSRRLKEQGRVILEILILPSGLVGEVKLKQSSGFSRLDQTAMKAIKRWRFVPATQAGKAVPYWYIQPLEFNLKQRN
jgi:protein TonB